MNKELKEKVLRLFGEEALKDLEETLEPLIYKDMEIVKWEKNDIQLKLPVTKDILNSKGIVHGGMLYTLCDMSTGLIAGTLGAMTITLQGNINYIKAVKEGNLFTRNKVMHNGKSTIVANVEVLNDDEELICSGVFTMFVVDRYDI